MPETLESLRASFNRSLRVEGKAHRTLTLYGQSITYFSAWLVEQGLPADLGPPAPVFSDEELTALVGACKGKGFNDLRDLAMIRLLIDCGLRVSELTGIDTKDLDIDAESVQVTGKGSRVRLAYFGSRTGLALDRYLRARRGHRHADDLALFLGERGRFTPDGVRERLKVRADRSGLDPRLVHPHRFRHTHAHDFLLAGGQERDLMRMLGWRSEAMLSRYGASAADHRAREVARRLRRGDRI